MKKIILMTFALLCTIGQQADAQTIYSYFWYSVDNTTHALKKNENALHEGKSLTSSTSVSNLSGWWGVEGTVTINSRINVTANTWIILCNGSTLYAKKGIFIDKGATLTIYASSEDEKTRGKQKPRVTARTGQPSAWISPRPCMVGTGEARGI